MAKAPVRSGGRSGGPSNPEGMPSKGATRERKLQSRSAESAARRARIEKRRKLLEEKRGKNLAKKVEDRDPGLRENPPVAKKPHEDLQALAGQPVSDSVASVEKSQPPQASAEQQGSSPLASGDSKQKTEENPVAQLQPESSKQTAVGKSAIWKTKDSDLLVKVIKNLGKGSDGREYVQIEGSNSGIPLDELNFVMEASQQEGAPVGVGKTTVDQQQEQVTANQATVEISQANAADSQEATGTPKKEGETGVPPEGRQNAIPSAEQKQGITSPTAEQPSQSAQPTEAEEIEQQVEQEEAQAAQAEESQPTTPEAQKAEAAFMQAKEAVLQRLKQEDPSRDYGRRLKELEREEGEEGKKIKVGKIVEEEAAEHYTKAGLYREEQARLISRLENQALLDIAASALKQDATEDDKAQAALVAKEKGSGSVEAMKQKADLQLRLLDAQDKLLNAKDGRKTLKKQMEEWADRVDSLSRTPSDAKAMEEAAYAIRRLNLEKQKLSREAVQIGEFSEEEREALAVKLGYKKDEKATAMQHLTKELTDLRETKSEAKKEDKKHKMAHPTWKGAWKELSATREVRNGAKEEIRRIQRGEGRHRGLTQEQKIAEIAKQRKTIDDANEQAMEMVKHIVGLTAKRTLIAWILVQIFGPIAAFMLMTKVTGKLLGVK